MRLPMGHGQLPEQGTRGAARWPSMTHVKGGSSANSGCSRRGLMVSGAGPLLLTSDGDLKFATGGARRFLLPSCHLLTCSPASGGVGQQPLAGPGAAGWVQGPTPRQYMVGYGGGNSCEVKNKPPFTTPLEAGRVGGQGRIQTPHGLNKGQGWLVDDPPPILFPTISVETHRGGRWVMLDRVPFRATFPPQEKGVQLPFATRLPGSQPENDRGPIQISGAGGCVRLRLGEPGAGKQA